MIRKKLILLVAIYTALSSFGILYIFIKKYDQLPTELEPYRNRNKPAKIRKRIYRTTPSHTKLHEIEDLRIAKKGSNKTFKAAIQKHTLFEKKLAITHTSPYVTKASKKKITIAKSNGDCDLNWHHPGINEDQYEVRIAVNTRLIPKKKFIPKTIYDNPFITLDPNRFLYAVLRWGPNNQLFGFHETVILSIALNRTVVLPRFIKHHKDRQRPMKEISPSHRIDIDTLCKFVSCISLDSFQKTCNYRVDAILNTKYLKIKEIFHMERYTGMRIIPQKGTFDPNFSSVLFPPNGTSKQNRDITFTVAEAKTMFNFSERCVLYPYPILDLKTYNEKGESVSLHGYARKKVSTEKVPESDLEIYASVLQHYQRPFYVRKMAAEFVAETICGQPFISVHWRYNKHDFLSNHHCNDQNLNKIICERAKEFTAEKLAKRITEEIKSLQRKKYDVKHIYIAAPPDLFKMMKDVKFFLQKKQPDLKLFTSTDLTNFINFRYKKCEVFMKHYDDILSTTEMEICSLGLEFIRSQGTTWSAYVLKSRMFGNITGIRQDFDSLVFDAI